MKEYEVILEAPATVRRRLVVRSHGEAGAMELATEIRDALRGEGELYETERAQHLLQQYAGKFELDQARQDEVVIVSVRERLKVVR